jgi:hypothetical protein
MLAMLVLSDELLRLGAGRISHRSPLRRSPDAGTWSICVPVLPFSAADWLDPNSFRPGLDGPTLIETEIVGDFIDLPGADLTALSGHSFDFPVNPVDGYIDASVDLGGAHNPIDVTRIEFGTAHGDSIDAILHAMFDFGHEGVDIENRTAILQVSLHYERVD